MKYAHVWQHVREYWNSLMRQSTGDRPNELAGLLQCPVFVINLERARHRREYILRHLASFGIEPRITRAIDGSTLDIPELERRRLYIDSVAHRTFSRSLSRAEIACSLSHVSIYRAMLEEDIAQAMVLEDDAMLVRDFTPLLERTLAEVPADWEVLQLFHNCNEQTAIGDIVVKFPGVSRLPVGAAAYLIRRSAAEKLLKHAIPISYPADSLIGRSHLWGVVLYGVARSVVTQNTIFPTDIFQHSTFGSKAIQAFKSVLIGLISSLAKLRRRT